jgi:predicted DNA-binding transcriptional regulator AlpA
MLTAPAEHDQHTDDADESGAAVVVCLSPLLLNIRQVCAMLGGISESKLRGMVSGGRFPRPKKIDRLARWRRSDVESWVARLD